MCDPMPVGHLTWASSFDFFDFDSFDFWNGRRYGRKEEIKETDEEGGVELKYKALSQ